MRSRGPTFAVFVALIGHCVTGLALAGPATRPSLKPGDPAPPLAVGKWIKGEPVARFEPGTVYVVEFWATWCGPCRAAFPHLTALQQKKYPAVVVIGQSVSEDDPARVRPFVEAQGDAMAYRVATDDTARQPGGVMHDTWLTAAGEAGIPTAFVIDARGRLAWIGTPGELDAVVARVITGQYDLSASLAKRDRAKALRAQIAVAVENKDLDAVLAAFRALREIEPDVSELDDAKFLYAIQLNRHTEAREAAAVLIDRATRVDELDTVALNLANQDGCEAADLALARRAVAKAEGLNPPAGWRPFILRTQALIAAREGDWPTAVALQRRAVEAAENAGTKAFFQRTLTAYETQRLPQ